MLARNTYAGKRTSISHVIDFYNTIFNHAEYITASDVKIIAERAGCTNASLYRLKRRLAIKSKYIKNIGWCHLRPDDWKEIPFKNAAKLKK